VRYRLGMSDERKDFTRLLELGLTHLSARAGSPLDIRFHGDFWKETAQGVLVALLMTEGVPEEGDR